MSYYNDLSMLRTKIKFANIYDIPRFRTELADIMKSILRIEKVSFLHVDELETVYWKTTVDFNDLVLDMDLADDSKVFEKILELEKFTHIDEILNNAEFVYLSLSDTMNRILKEYPNTYVIKLERYDEDDLVHSFSLIHLPKTVNKDIKFQLDNANLFVFVKELYVKTIDLFLEVHMLSEMPAYNEVFIDELKEFSFDVINNLEYYNLPKLLSSLEELTHKKCLFHTDSSDLSKFDQDLIHIGFTADNNFIPTILNESKWNSLNYLITRSWMQFRYFIIEQIDF